MDYAINALRNQPLSSLVFSESELTSFKNDYAERIERATYFRPTKNFIEAEISEFTDKMSRPSFTVTINHTPSEAINLFQHSSCGAKAFNYLMRGEDYLLGQIIDGAREECRIINREILNKYGKAVAYVPCDSEQFDEICLKWIRSGVTFALYIKFLYEQLKAHEIISPVTSILINNTGNNVLINAGNQNNINASLKNGE